MSTRPPVQRWGRFDRLLALTALAAGAAIALRASSLGDYPDDAGPALSAIAHGALGGFFSHQPAMGAVSLYVRAPFVILAAAIHDSPLGLYRWGAVPCVLSVSLVAVWMARLAGRRGTGRVGRGAIVAVCLLGPLIGNALTLGHPEELLTASLAIGALLAASERRVVLTAVLAGLAVASKQWALLVVCPALLVLERERMRAAVLMLGVGAASTLPMAIGNFASFRHALAYISAPQSVNTLFNWFYPFSPTGTVRSALIFGPARFFTWHRDPGIVMALSHPLIIALGVLVPLLVWYARGRRLTAQDMLIAAALVFLLRCALDPVTWPYYHLPLLLTLVALDATAGRRLPLAGLAGAAGAFVVLDRLPGYLPTEATNLVYVLASAVTLTLLVRELRLPALGSQAARAGSDPRRASLPGPPVGARPRP